MKSHTLTAHENSTVHSCSIPDSDGASNSPVQTCVTLGYYFSIEGYFCPLYGVFTLPRLFLRDDEVFHLDDGEAYLRHLRCCHRSHDCLRLVVSQRSSGQLS